MGQSRRDFLKTAAMAAVATAAGCGKQESAGLPRPDLAASGQKWVKTVCRFCGTGCGVQVAEVDGRVVALRGDPEHPTTKGLVCAKALFLPKILHSPDRLTKPQIRKNGEMVDATWEEAMSLVAEKFASAISEKGVDSVAYYGSGQCLSEESYLANRLFKGGIGTNNVEGNPRLCMASAVGGYVSTFGKDEPMGCYDDIDHAKVFFLVGSNTAECHPIIFDRILMAKQKDESIKVIQLDPRSSPVRTIADLHLAPVAGYDLAIFHGMAHVILKENLGDPEFLANKIAYMSGSGEAGTIEDYIAFLEDFTPEKAAEQSGVPAADIVKAARWFAVGPTMSLWTMGLNQRTRGVWANNLVHNLHLITGWIGKPGATPFSLTGQPNACGGVRDTGSLSHILPYGRVVKKPEHREQMEQLWGCAPGTIKPTPGLNTIEMFKALARDEVQAMLISTTNPGHSLPNVTPYRDAMGKERPNKPFICVLDIFPTRTTELADVILPAAMWCEKEGVFGMSERRYQLLPKVVDAPGQARPDLEVFIELAKRLEEAGMVPKGYIAGNLETSEDVWNEMREAGRDTPYDFHGMTRERLRKERGLRWPCPTPTHGGTARRFVKGEDPLLDAGPFADDSVPAGDISFYARPDKRAVVWMRPALGPAEPVDDEFPWILSTGRVLEHWHTATMTMRADQLRQAQPKAFVEVNPRDAAKLGVASGDLLKIISRRGEAQAPVRVVDTPRDGMVFVPWHWEDEESFINRVTIDAYDPGSKQPEFKICAVKLAKV